MDNAKQLIDGIPSCVGGCFQNAVDMTNCNKNDYDCYCYANNHQTIVDTMEVCLINQARRLGKNCTDEDMFQMENRYWMVCEQYWEPTGTATEPASATMTPTSTSTSTSSTEPSTTDPTSLDAPNSTPSPLADQKTEHPVGYQVGIAIGAFLIVVLVVVGVWIWFRERKKRRMLEENINKLRKSLSANLENGKSQPYEMEGDERHIQELRGDPGTPELEIPTSSVDNGESTFDGDARKRLAPQSPATTETLMAPSPEMDSMGVSHGDPADPTSDSLWSSSPRPPPLNLPSQNQGPTV